jgi:hypothetical protein
MTLKITGICLIMSLVLATSPLHAQNKLKKSSTKKETVKEEPPPEVERLEATTISEELPFDTTSAPNDALTAAIKELMTLTGAMDLGKQMGRNIAQIQNSGPNQLPQEFYDRLLKEYDNEQTNRWMVNAIVKIYRKKFTLDEVQAITAFYNTPVGKKTIQLLPQIMQESMKEGEQIGRYLGMKIYYELVREGKLK